MNNVRHSMKYRTGIIIVMAICMVFLAASFQKTYASETIDSGTCGDHLSWSLDDAGALTINGSGDMTSFKREKNAPWYKHKDSIKTIRIKDGVTSIGRMAFYKYSNVRSVTIPASLKIIEDVSFTSCSSITDVYVENSSTHVNNSIELPNGLISIGGGVFHGLDNIVYIETPPSIKSIGGGTFNCANLKTLILNGSDAVINQDVISSDDTMLETLVIGDGIKRMGEFYYTKFNNLQNLYLSSNTKYGIENPETFIENKTVVQKVVYTGTGRIDEFNFPLLSNEIVIEDGVKIIGDYAFRDSRATSIIIPPSVTKIEEFAFCDCRKLKKLIIGSGVKRLDGQIVDGCKKLTAITLQTKKLTAKSIKKECLSYSAVKTVYVKVGSKAENKKYIKKYKKIFTKKKVGRSVKVK